jgi:hypothetical protein
VRQRVLLAGLLLAFAPKAWAVREWYDFYLDARDKLIPANRCEDALKNLRDAEQLKPASALNEQTYGLQFVDYTPYYYQGICYLKQGDYNSAIRYFNIEEDKGAIRRSEPLYKELKRLRSEAEKQRIARLTQDKVDQLIQEGKESFKAKKFDEALTRLATAQSVSEALDPTRQGQIKELTEQIKAAKNEVESAESRAKRIEEDLSEGRRLLEEGKATDASVRFDAVLGLDPRNARALEGKNDAKQRILASTTRQERTAAFLKGKDLFEAGRYAEALEPLTDGAADPANAEARGYLEKARKALEGLRIQKDVKLKIDRLMEEGELLLQHAKYPEAQVAFDAILQLDSANLRARDRRNSAASETGRKLLEQFSPNQKPTLNFFEPRVLEILGPTVALVGVATDDRGIASIDFRAGGRALPPIAPLPSADLGEPPRNVRFERTVPLDEGSNDIVVTVTDSSGLKDEKRFTIVRRLRFYETRAFLPSALAAALGLIGLGTGLQHARRRRAVRNRFNPYIAGAPVLDDGMFFGREKLLSRILNVLHHNSLMITGERRIGKTTFLYHLKKALETDEATDYRFFPVFTDLQGVPESSFFHAVMSDVVETLKPLPATLTNLRFKTQEEAYDGRDFSHDLQRVIEELKTRTAKRVKLALLIDEVDVLNDYSERINQRLRSIFMKTFSEQLVAIMSGVSVKRTWRSEGSPWYNFFDEVELTAFTRDEAEALIRTPVMGVFRYEPEAVDAIIAYSELKPYIIQKFCIGAVNRMLEARRTTITVADVEGARGEIDGTPREAAALGHRELSA